MKLDDGRSEENDHASKGKKLMPLFLVVGGTVMGILSTGITLYGLFSPSDDAATDSCG
jgi:hypothetical protein